MSQLNSKFIIYMTLPKFNIILIHETNEDDKDSTKLIKKFQLKQLIQ